MPRPASAAAAARRAVVAPASSTSQRPASSSPRSARVAASSPHTAPMIPSTPTACVAAYPAGVSMSGEGPNSAVRPMLVPIIATRRARSAAVGTPLKARAVAVSALGAFPQFSVPYHDAGSASVRTTPQGNEWLTELRPRFSPGKHPALWITERVGRLSPRSINEAFVSVREAAGLDDALDVHCLRHSAVTHWTEFGYPARFVQEQVGHSHAATTAIYTGVSNEFRNTLLAAALKNRLGAEWESDT
ncbi:tyrosine-type recombinase/integrase [Nocardia elegans]|uniref:Tyr recombinase domain-containing protein n=1 Tax=Nocardia nova TaxID=37330 RepID=A0A2T2Z755_9NOCA|nr:tyrosine-type recombinase/integrase [Nocardia elegans]PSR63580.1 hypothetical protein C8259_13090 [Nocardia nova]